MQEGREDIQGDDKAARRLVWFVSFPLERLSMTRRRASHMPPHLAHFHSPKMLIHGEAVCKMHTASLVRFFFPQSLMYDEAA